MKPNNGQFNPTTAIDYKPTTCRLPLPSPEGCGLVLILDGGMCDGEKDSGRDQVVRGPDGV